MHREFPKGLKYEYSEVGPGVQEEWPSPACLQHLTNQFHDAMFVVFFFVFCFFFAESSTNRHSKGTLPMPCLTIFVFKRSK